MSILTVTCYGIEFSWEFCFPFGPMATFVRRLKVKYGLFSFKKTLLKFYFLALLILYFFRICRLPHFHGFIFIFVYFIERKKQTQFLYDFFMKYKTKTPPRKYTSIIFTLLNISLFTFKIWLQPFRKSHTSKISIDSQDEHIFQNFSTFLYTCKFYMNQRKNNHHFISLTLIWTWKKNR